MLQLGSLQQSKTIQVPGQRVGQARINDGGPVRGRQIRIEIAPALEGAGGALGETAQMLGITDGGYRALPNIGEHGLQEVPHFHVHLFGGQPLGRMIKPPGK